jgi:hypothetical protein
MRTVEDDGMLAGASMRGRDILSREEEIT